MIVGSGLYIDGRRAHEVESVDGVLQRARAHGPGAFAWIGYHEPSRDELAAATREFGLHPVLVEDVINAHQRPKVERYGDVAFVVLKTACYHAPDRVQVGEIQLIVSHDFVITIRQSDATPLAHVRRQLEENDDLLAHGPAAVLYAVADAIVDDYAHVIDELELDVDESTEAVFSTEELNPAERLFRLKREVLGLLRAAVPVGEAVADLAASRDALLVEELHPYFRDVSDHVTRAIGRLDMIRDLLSDALNANLAQVGVRQNDDMRTISAWAALIAAPTMLAGIWGMNFRNMPELGWQLGYPAAIGSMVLSVGVLYWYFRKVGWIRSDR